MFAAALFTIAGVTWDERISHTWPNHTVEYHSALKRKEIPTRMSLEDVMLSEISQSQKDGSCLGCRGVKTIGQKVQRMFLGAARGGRRGR